MSMGLGIMRGASCGGGRGPCVPLLSHEHTALTIILVFRQEAVVRELGSISYRNKKDISTQTGFPRLLGTIAQK